MEPPSVILGVSSDYHDSAACLLIEGEIVAAALEERFTRLKHDSGLPRNSIQWCLSEGGVGARDVDVVALHNKPLSTYERILVTHALGGPRGAKALTQAVSSWSGRKLWIGYRVERLLRELGYRCPTIRWVEHHQSHAAAAYFPSPFDEAAVLTVDGVGEWVTAAIGHGAGNRLQILEEMRFPESLGLFYSAMTAYCGFAVNDGEFKLMGLAPYGEPVHAETLQRCVVHVDEDGRFRLDQRWFDWQSTTSMTRPGLAELLGVPPRMPNDPLEQQHADLAASTQLVTEEALLAFACRVHRQTGAASLVMAGGVALNCVANARLLRDGPFEQIWVQPAAGDDGSAVGAAMWVWHQLCGAPREPSNEKMRGGFLGPSFHHEEVAEWLAVGDVPHSVPATPDELFETVTDALADGGIVGWFMGAMEFGPRALGHRSILADPRDPTMVSRLNRSIKGREGFRPFAPSVLAEEASAWFDIDSPMPYMLFTAQVANVSEPERPDRSAPFADRLAQRRSPIPACTHVDGSARVHTVDPVINPEFHGLLQAFHRRTGCPVLVNTSFNRDGEPIVCTPEDAYRTFLMAGLDMLVLEGCVIRRDELCC